MRTTIVWADDLADIAAGEVGVAVLSLHAPAIRALATLPPTAADLADIGARAPLEAERFLARRAILRHWIGRQTGAAPNDVVIASGPTGAPEVRSSTRPFFCSVAARGDRAAFAIADAPVGVDIEPVEDGLIAWEVLSSAERAALQNLPEPDRILRFLTYWTVKEAYLKATGEGLGRDPATVTVTEARDGWTVVDASGQVQGPMIETRRLQVDSRPVLVAVAVLPPSAPAPPDRS